MSFWAKNYPPNGWGCRCRVDAYSKRALEKRGWSAEEEPDWFKADKDWGYDKRNLSNSDSGLEKILKQKVARIKETNDPDKLIRGFLAEDLAQMREDRERWTAFKSFFAKPEGNFELAKLAPNIKKVLMAETDTILLSADTVKTHSYHPEIKAFDYYLIKYMQKNTLFAIQKGNTHIILLKKLGIVYEVVLKATKNKKEVYLTTMFKVSDVAVEKKRLIKQGLEIKI